MVSSNNSIRTVTRHVYKHSVFSDFFSISLSVSKKSEVIYVFFHDFETRYTYWLHERVTWELSTRENQCRPRRGSYISDESKMLSLDTFLQRISVSILQCLNYEVYIYVSEFVSFWHCQYNMFNLIQFPEFNLNWY